MLAPNPSVFTGAGTNTYVVGDETVVVIDPGPIESSHERAIVAEIADRPVHSVIVTHTHPDHAPLANPLARALGVPALGYEAGPEFEPDSFVRDGTVLEVPGMAMTAIHTPGHSDDHLCFLVGRSLFTGDHIMGGSSVMVDDLSLYLQSLERLQTLDLERLYPGHGPELAEPQAVISWYLAHRLQREAEIVAALEVGAGTVEEVVEVVYAEVDRTLHPLAARSVRAHLRKLSDEGLVVLTGDSSDPAVGLVGSI